MVIIPRIEYQMQAVILDKNECTKLICNDKDKQINRLVKNRANLAKSTPNFLIYENIYDLQIEMLCKNLIYQANGNGKLSLLSKIKLIQLQDKICKNSN